MKERLIVMLLVVVVISVLAALSAATYSQKDRTPDSEAFPNRSTFNSGPTGTQAFYSLLSETGHGVIRWQQNPVTLTTAKSKERPSVFVIVGATRRSVERNEAEAVLRWVASGGRLVIVDREPSDDLIKTSSAWRMAVTGHDDPEIFTTDPFDQAQMTEDTPAVKPVQPSLFTSGVNAVQTSRFAASVGLNRSEVGDADEHVASPIFSAPSNSMITTPADYSPAVHVASPDKNQNILVDAPYGEGRIVILTDPYVVSNGGIRIADNARLAVNLVSSDGLIAFDEYHQGYGADSGRFVQFFAGTPVLALFLQGAFIVGFLFYSQSRRFGRAIPEQEPDRLSKLEYVTAMAELQQRTRAYDLALENIYTDFRRRATRALGLDAMTTTPREIAQAIAGSIGGDPSAIERTAFNCEEIIRGEPTNKSEVTRLVSELRELESKLALRRSVGKRLQ
jgi:hypothetical protein